MLGKEAFNVGTEILLLGAQSMIAGKIKMYWANYGSNDLDEIRWLRKFYSEYCYPVEKNHLPNTLQVRFQVEVEAEKVYPIYFQMKIEGDCKQPYYYINRLETHVESAFWKRFVKDGTILTTIINDMIATICAYQEKRNKQVFFAKGAKGFSNSFSYDPTNLFFEEFKLWLVELSKANFDEATINVILGRIDYLHAIDIHEIFPQSDNCLTRHKTVVSLKDQLKLFILPTITNKISSEGAREHFEALTNNIGSLIQWSTQFCLYVFRDTPNTTVEFSYGAVVRATNNMGENVFKTRSGQLLHRLAAIDLDSFSAKLLESGESEFKDIFSVEQLGQRAESGIHEHFEKPAILRAFVQYHNIIRRLKIFGAISKNLHYFAGEGGNMLVYGYAATKVKALVSSYLLLVDEFQKTLRYLHSAANNFRLDLVYRTPQKHTRQELVWKELFRAADDAFNKLCHNTRGLLLVSYNIICKIEEKIAYVNSHHYEAELRAKVDDFDALVHLFYGTNPSQPLSNSSTQDCRSKGVESSVAKRWSPSMTRQLGTVNVVARVAIDTLEIANQLHSGFILFSNNNFNDALLKYIELLRILPEEVYVLQAVCHCYHWVRMKNPDDQRYIEEMNFYIQKYMAMISDGSERYMNPAHARICYVAARLYFKIGKQSSNVEDLKKCLAYATDTCHIAQNFPQDTQLILLINSAKQIAKNASIRLHGLTYPDLTNNQKGDHSLMSTQLL